MGQEREIYIYIYKLENHGIEGPSVKGEGETGGGEGRSGKCQNGYTRETLVWVLALGRQTRIRKLILG